MTERAGLPMRHVRIFINEIHSFARCTPSGELVTRVCVRYR